jgi:hypothetical protein
MERHKTTRFHPYLDPCRPPLSSQASILANRTSCEVAGAFTVTVSRVAGPGAPAVNPHRRNSPIASAAASYSESASNLDCVPDALAVGERDQAGAGGGASRNIVALGRRKEEEDRATSESLDLEGQ